MKWERLEKSKTKSERLKKFKIILEKLRKFEIKSERLKKFEIKSERLEMFEIIKHIRVQKKTSFNYWIKSRNWKKRFIRTCLYNKESNKYNNKIGSNIC